ncbi:MAG: ribonuclease HI family protein [Patescibacteria group bacterium]|nr:ribonuclease HI family protein [Patescibacteria group bacterium]
MTDKIIIYSDGGSRGNPGPAAIGALVEINGNAFEVSECIGKATNNIAEYEAAIAGLKKAQQLLGKRRAKMATAECFLDSELVVKQINGEYKIKESTLYAPFIELRNLTLDFRKVKFVHIKRELNKKADSLVNQALDSA